MAFEPGELASDYEILGELGKGGMGRVYRVRNVISNRVEAMKVLLADVAAEADLGDRFVGEIRTLARLDHPNIAKFHTAFRVGNQLVMVMEYVEGTTLTERSKQSPMPLDEVLGYISQTLAALGYAHQNGVIHRDIKPSNIMVTPHGVVKLMDFGIAKSSLDPLVTKPGTTMGSMLYMSPEQVRGVGVDARSDLYSMGIVLYELSAGRRPFEGENTFAILDAHLNTPPKAPIELNPALPPALNEIILTALDKEPMRRFQTAEAFQNALASLRQREPQPAARAASMPPVAMPGVKKSQRGLWMAAGAVACVAVLAGGVIALPHFFHSSAASAPHVSDTASRPEASPTPAPVPEPQKVATPVPDASPAQAPVPAQPMEDKPGGIQPAVRTPRTVPQPSPAPVSVAPPVVKAQDNPPPEVKPAGPSKEEVDAAEESQLKLTARADAVRGSLNNLRAQQASSGLGLRGDMAASASRMDSYLAAGERALAAQDVAAAQKNFQRAEDEINKLEAFLGR